MEGREKRMGGERRKGGRKERREKGKKGMGKR